MRIQTVIGKEKRKVNRQRERHSKACWMAAVFLAALLLTPMIARALGTPAGTVISNSATVNYQDASANNFSAVSNTTTVTVTSVFSVTVTTPPDQAVPSNTTAYYAYTVTNTGNDNNTFALSAASGAGGNNWTVVLYADDGAGGGTANDGIHQAGETNITNSTGVLPADNTYRFFLAVTIPAGVANGQTDDSVLTVTGSGDPGAGDDTSDTVTTTAQAPTLTVTKQVRNVTDAGAFGNTANAAPGNTLEYQLHVVNGGTVAATNIVLTDNTVGTSTTYTAGSIWIGSNGTTYNGGGNANKTDSNSGDPACGAEACGAANVTGGILTAYLGNGATESTGGSLGLGSEVWVYFRVTVD